MCPVAVVTGAASGIGAATLRRFAAQGWDAVGIDRAAGAGLHAADITDPSALMAAADKTPSVQALVCAAGVLLSEDDRYATVDDATWQRTWEVNVTGTMLTLRAFGPRLTAGSAVTTVASVVALAGFPRRDAYTASKGAVVALSRAWAADLIRHAIRVNCVCPGVTDTPMAAPVIGAEDLELPLGRAATPEEVAEVIVAISSPSSSYLAGTVIPVDGGLTAAARTARLDPRYPASGVNK